MGYVGILKQYIPKAVFYLLKGDYKLKVSHKQILQDVCTPGACFPYGFAEPTRCGFTSGIDWGYIRLYRGYIRVRKGNLGFGI